MQIVRDLGGYSMGRSDNVRRAMSKKKVHVMETERDIFINGNDAEIAEAMANAEAKGISNPKIPAAVPGCVRNGISAVVADGIYETMMDFAKYAFNKSHAACYAVVAYQTAYLKQYYPVEYMAALMTSVIDNAGKVSEYIQTCRNMGIKILPPDINEGEASFSVSNGAIRYALTAIKNVGRNVIDSVVEERQQRGPFTDLKDFVIRVGESNVNKRAMENFIKAGAFDSFGATRKQLMCVFNQVMDSIHSERKSSFAGQMTLFDMAAEEDKESFTVTLPKDVGEYPKDTLLAFEKEVLGVYVSGHPLDEYRGLWNRMLKTKTTDFILQTAGAEDTGDVNKPQTDSETIAIDGTKVAIGGMIVAQRVQYTKKNDKMAYVTLEDLVGTVEVIVFPKAYEKYNNLLLEDSKVIMRGRVQAEENKDGKLICEEVIPFSNLAKNIWLQLDSEEGYEEKYKDVLALLHDSDGHDRVILYFKDTKQKMEFSRNRYVNADEELLGILKNRLGEENIRITY